MKQESQPIITPHHFNLPELQEDVILFFLMGQFFQFHEWVNGGKIKSYGPARRFSFTHKSQTCSVLGGFIGAPLAAIIVENALVSGGRCFKSFGTAGWIGKGPAEIGELHRPAKGWDNTGIIRDYGCESRDTRFIYANHKPTCDCIVSVNSFYRLTPVNLSSYQHRGFNLIDMEAAPLNHIITEKGGTFEPLFVISDRIEKENQWFNGTTGNSFSNGVEQAMNQLLE